MRPLASLRPVLASSTLIAALWDTAALPPAAAQQQPLPEVFGEFLDVRVVNLEVVVTDRSGGRVHGLTADDFVLVVDGQEVAIEYFSEIRGGMAQSGGHIESPPGVEPGEAIGTNFLVYVDDNHTRKVDRDPIVRALIDQVDELGPRDRMAVLVHQGTRLQMLSSWSSSPKDLAAALGQLLDGQRFGGSTRSPLQVARTLGLRPRTSRLVDVTADAPGGGSAEDALLVEMAETLPEASFLEALGGAPLRLDLELAVASAVSALRGFAQPEGRKVMLLVAGQWPLGAFRSGTAGIDIVTDLDLVRPLVETANLLAYTVYPIGDQASTNLWRNTSSSRIASDTGGQMLYRRAELLRGAVADTRSYYFLGFVPELVADDARHRIQVEVRRSGLRTRTRDSYVDLSRSAELSMMAQSALLFGEELPAGPVQVRFGQAERKGLRKMMVPIEVLVPLDELTFVRQRDTDHARFEIRLAVIDESGSQADIPILPVELEGTYRPGEVYRYTTMLRMRRRPHDMAVSVHDVYGARTLNGVVSMSYRSTQDDQPP
ncbi:MAG TPA: VWA domain-containing protein [Thermoanaerobaculia bacterium]|nr:VWA domain-containing protein [Thermoanaerobaculia bacterium]